MLDEKGFNLWAGNYDKTVGISDEKNEYPFAGYKELMNWIFVNIAAKGPAKVLDIGLGTGVISSKLYEHGNEITGIDFSAEMLQIAKQKMAEAKFIKHDFSKGMPLELKGCKFDFIISTYALHHLMEEEKPAFILSLLEYLNTGGKIFIGDVCFDTIKELEDCKKSAEDKWDTEEYYFVYEDIKAKLDGKCTIEFIRFSHCSGILAISE